MSSEDKVTEIYAWPTIFAKNLSANKKNIWLITRILSIAINLTV